MSIKKQDKEMTTKAFNEVKKKKKQAESSQVEVDAHQEQQGITPKREIKPLFYILFFIILTSVGGAVFLWGNSIQQQLKEDLNLQQQQNNEQVNNLKKLEKTVLDQQTTQSTALAELKDKVNKITNQVDSIQSQLKLTQQQLEKEKGGLDFDLLLSEADFLIRTAAIRLVLTENTTSTIRLLEAADQRLLRLGDVGIIPVREALAEDIYKLKASEQKDVSGNYIKLDVIGKNLSTLKLNYILPQQEEVQKTTEKPTTDWKDHLSKSSEKVLTKWFQVTHYKETVKPLQSAEQEMFIKQSIALTIKQAQLAFIQKDFELYQSVLSHLQNEIKNNFNSKNKKTTTAQKEITKLISNSMVAPSPKVLTVEKKMKAFLSQRDNMGKQ